MTNPTMTPETHNPPPSSSSSHPPSSAPGHLPTVETPSPSPSPPPPATIPRAHRISRASDILLDPIKSTQRRYAAYVRARHRFWDAFPHGAYARLPTPGTDLECGLHALRLSMQHLPAEQQQLLRRIRIPTLAELRDVYRTSASVARENAARGMDNEVWFTADQLAALFAEWGRRYLSPNGDGEEGGGGGGEGEGGVRCQLGYITDDGVPVMMNTPWVDTGEVVEGILRVWVYNDGDSLRGGMGHFEGVRRLTEEEMRVLEEKEGG